MKHLILGNGPAGVVAAETLRAAAANDHVLLVGNEEAPPYSRMAIPYLLEDDIDEAGTYLRKSAGHFERLNIRQRRAMAVSVKTDKRTVRFDDGHLRTGYWISRPTINEPLIGNRLNLPYKLSLDPM